MAVFVLPAALRPIRAAVLLLCALGLVVLDVGVAAPVSASPAMLVSDGFSRTVATGWGAADRGGSWRVSARSRFAVTDGVGTVALTRNGRTRFAIVPGKGTTAYVSTVLSVSAVPRGNGLYASIVGRRVPGAGTYLARIRFLPDGTVAVTLTRRDAAGRDTVLAPETVVAGVAGGAGQRVRVRVQVAGTGPTTIRAQVSQAGSAISGWDLTATDATPAMQQPGGVGLSAYLSRRSRPVTLQVDDVDASLMSEAGQPAPAEQGAPGGRGTPPSGQPSGSVSGPSVPGRAAGSAGSAPVGSARYPVPADALYVSPSGSDSGSGTAAAPFRTVARAVAAAPSGAAVVLRAGTYSESVTIPRGKRLTLQGYPGEAVWLDGSRPMTAWTADGDAWQAGWTTQLDHSPTYTAGAPDGSAANWGFVNADYPMAAHPEQVLVDGVPQRQVATRAAVVAGTFSVDDAADRLYLGTDPAGHEVRASVLRIGLTVSGAGSLVRGLGIQRYATPVPDKGALRSLAVDVTIENVVVRDNATQGIYVGGQGLGVRNTLRHVTAERNGLLGIESSYSDGLVVDGVRAVGNNTEHFNTAPVSGGMKITRARGITVTDGVYARNLGPGLWFDESVHDATVTGNDLLDNRGHGLSFEISSKAVIADNLVAGNGDSGLKLNNAGQLEVRNNTVVDNTGRPIWLVQDARVASNLSTPGHDPRQQLPDPTVTWLLGPATVEDNVIGGTTSAHCLLCVQDSALRRTAEQIAVTADGNVYLRAGTGSPRYTATWPVGAGNPQTYASVAAFRGGTGQEPHGIELVGQVAVDAGYRLTAAVPDRGGARVGAAFG